MHAAVPRGRRKSVSVSTLLVLMGSIFGIVVLEAAMRAVGRPPSFNPQTFPRITPIVGEQSSREILGPAATTHGIFPKTPSITYEPHPLRGFRAGAGSGEFIPNQVWAGGKGFPFQILVQSGRTRMENSGEVIYDSRFTIDSWARRVTPVSNARKAPKKEFAIFLGCSVTFGMGVEDSKTIPAYFSAAAPAFQAYNYAVPAFSPGDALMRLRAIQPGQEIPQKQGVVLYLYINDQLNRLVGPMSWIARWGGRRIEYLSSSAGEIGYTGKFEDVHWLRTTLFRWFYSLETVQRLGIDIPWAARGDDFELLATIIKNMEREALGRLHARRFLVVIAPPMFNQRFTEPELVRYLESRRISYVDLSHWQMDRFVKGDAWFRDDGHPTAETNRVLGTVLAEVVRASSVP